MACVRPRLRHGLGDPLQRSPRGAAHLLAAFLLGGFGIGTPLRENVLCVLIIAAIGTMGHFRGLDMLLVLERWPLRATGVLVLALVVGFAAFDWRAIATNTL